MISNSYTLDTLPNLKAAVQEYERQIITQALLLHGGNQVRTARALGMTRRGFIYKLERLGLKAPPNSCD